MVFSAESRVLYLRCGVERSGVAYAPAVRALNGRKVAHESRILNGGFTITNVDSYIDAINSVFYGPCQLHAVIM